MDPATIEAFLSVVSTRSISGAAEMLYLSQSTVSTRIRTLEEQLGVRLMERSRGHRRIVLTPRGEEFVPLAERFMQLHREADELRQHDSILLSVRATNSLNVYMLGDFYRKLSLEHPGIRLQIYSGNTPETYEQMEARKIDLGVVHGMMHYPHVEARLLFRDRFCVVMLEQESPPPPVLHPTDLDFSREIRFTWLGSNFAQWRSRWFPAPAQYRIEVDTVALLMQLLHGDCWTILPFSVIQSLKNTWPLTVCELAEGPPDRMTCLVRHRSPRQSAVNAIRTFEEALLAFVQESELYAPQ